MAPMASPVSACANSDASMKSEDEVRAAIAAFSASGFSSALRSSTKSIVGMHVGIDHRVRAAALVGQERRRACGHDQVAAEREVGVFRCQAHGVQFVLVGGDAQMRHHRAVLLRHAHQVEHGAALAFEMRGHAEDRADGDDARAADAGDQHAVGAVERTRRRGRRQLGRDARRARWTPPCLRMVEPCTVTKLGQKPLMQE